MYKLTTSRETSALHNTYIILNPYVNELQGPGSELIAFSRGLLREVPPYLPFCFAKSKITSCFAAVSLNVSSSNPWPFRRSLPVIQEYAYARLSNTRSRRVETPTIPNRNGDPLDTSFIACHFCWGFLDTHTCTMTHQVEASSSPLRGYGFKGIVLRYDGVFQDTSSLQTDQTRAMIVEVWEQQDRPTPGIPV